MQRPAAGGPLQPAEVHEGWQEIHGGGQGLHVARGSGRSAEAAVFPTPIAGHVVPAVVEAAFVAPQSAPAAAGGAVVAGKDQEHVVLKPFGSQELVELPQIGVDVLNQPVKTAFVSVGRMKWLVSGIRGQVAEELLVLVRTLPDELLCP